MKLSLAIALVLVSTTVGRADTPAATVADELGELGGEAAPLPPGPEAEVPVTAAPPAATPATAPPPRARMSTPAGRTIRLRVKDDGESRLDKTEDTVLGGRHWRIKTAQGAVHVWVPPGYDRATAGTVVYVHGYWTDADGAWKEHELARQFKMSRQTAIFIVPVGVATAVYLE
ncbi:MAG: hypothetical protein WKG01_03505, partial [Kofleriaceae bacterium]